MKRMRVLAGWIFVMVVFAIQTAIYARCQPRIALGNGRGDDGVTYGAVAEQIANKQPIRGPAPFVYRIGASWIAAQYAIERGVSVDQAFQLTNAIMMVMTLTLIYFMGIHFCSPLFAALASILYSLPWWSYTRCIWFYPLLNDLPWLLLMLGSVCVIVYWPRNKTSPWRIAVFALLSFLSPLTRETGILTPIIWICSRAWFFRHDALAVFNGDSRLVSLAKTSAMRREVMLSGMFVCLALAGLAVTRCLAFSTDSDDISMPKYSLLCTAVHCASFNIQKGWHYPLSCCLAYGGPLLALLILYGKYMCGKIDQTPAVGFYPAAILFLAFFGGVNTLRFLSWGSPVVLILIAHLAEKFWNVSSGEPGRFAARSLLIVNITYYVIMIHPFSGYYGNYSAWTDWGGLQSSSNRSVAYWIPCLGLLVGSVIVGWRIIGNGNEKVQCKDPPFPKV